ncbi:hypothetical protein Swit_1080 [Rhizorhabdus wittichii RW1]|uniref:Capsule synthesis protein CapA domain-containing protein n=1 Tax=Rhizorhabdus wittichii (strain DSM 6014 / CCUG 31198 / JCM 15750 / NBRC 105917 / EY 4224 / RW1) TaxID=392499 RepID=A0A9J9LDX1_RHIWR|nr:hypothetical protein Swit_1080 [Rhizorhabdus wittichii RW1]
MTLSRAWVRWTVGWLGAAALVTGPAFAGKSEASSAPVVTVAFGGDMIGPVHPMNRAGDPAFAGVAELFRKADVGFVNQENAVFDLNRFSGYPAAENGGGYPLRYAGHAAELKDMGATLVSLANNHPTDWGSEGLAATLRNLAAAGVVAGGAAMSDAAARGPVFQLTPKGAVALVATASTFPPTAVAGPAIERHAMMSQPRPGISPLHVRKVRVVPPPLYKVVLEAAGPTALRDGPDMRVGDQVFRQGDSLGSLWEMKPSDRDALLDAVAEARKRAGLVLFSIHAHETAGEDEEPAVPYHPVFLQHANEAASPNDPRPASFQVELFHAAIDHGASAVARHGPHIISGIEIYKGKPIFYGLGSLFLDFGGARVLDTPSGETIHVPDIWYESFVPVVEYQGERVRSIRLYPVLIEDKAGPRSGSPSLARGERARTILGRLQALSAPFGTKIRINGDIGIVELE